MTLPTQSFRRKSRDSKEHGSSDCRRGALMKARERVRSCRFLFCKMIVSPLCRLYIASVRSIYVPGLCGTYESTLLTFPSEVDMAVELRLQDVCDGGYCYVLRSVLRV